MGNREPPPKESMTRLGVCSMIIEPHVFEVSLHTVIELPSNKPPPPVKPPPLSTPQYNPFSHNPAYAQSAFNMPLPGPPPAYQAQQHSYSSQQSLPPFREGFGSFGHQGPPPIYHPPVRTHAHPQSSKVAPLPGPSSLPGVLDTAQGASQDEGGDSKADPVIQMLANRAANDGELKNLMRVVASGKASHKQLKEFQDHIDELNSMLKSGSNPPDSIGGNVRANKPPLAFESGYPSSVPLHSPKPVTSWNQPVQGTLTSFGNQTIPPIKTEPSSKSYSVPATPPVPEAPIISKSEISGIVFDFGGSGDRYSLPRFSILEYLYGGTQVIVSFIVIRQGNLAASGNYKGNMSYYQPVTLRLTTLQPQILEPLSRFVAPAEEVRSYMNSYFDRLRPAESVHLATRLPRTTDGENGEKPDMTPQSDAPSIKAVYSPPNSIMPLAA